jgi:5-methyltetrahydropteroyltriglutamate--homocysteine methyltransferase
MTTVTERSTPPFRAEHVGSLIRPARLRDAREAWMAGKMTAADLKAIEDQCIDEAVALQERVGLQSITDGEFRRPSWRDGFFDNVDGFSREREVTDFVFKLADGTTQRTAPVPHVVSRLHRRRGIATREFEYLRSATRRTPKITLPAPSVMHFFRGGRSIDPAVYADATEYMVDVARIYREELADLAALGCRYVQLDEVALPVMCDAGAQHIVRARGESVDRTVALYIDALNEAVRNRPSGMTIVVHMCRGNVGDGMASTGYDPIAERAFATLNVDGFLLEFDTPRAGDFTPLRFVPKGKFVALGLVSTKVPDIEKLDDLRRRIDAAARVLPLDCLGLCPQCGFASGFRTARLTIADEERKLANLVQVAERVWS